MCDELDQWIVQALQIDGRASFSRIGEVLGVSAQTVARRYRRLRGARVLRVIGKPYLNLIGQAAWMLRITCVPDATERIAGVLAARPDTNWVQLSSDGTEIVCGLRAAPDQSQALLAKLPRTPRVVGVTGHCVLRRFRGGPAPWTGWTRPLTEEQRAELSRGRADGPYGPSARRCEGGVTRLDEVDTALFEVLAEDGRSTVSELAARTGLSESAARRRLQEHTDSGLLYFEVDFDARAIGMHTQALLWLSVPPAALASTGAALATHREVAFAAATSGRYSIVVAVVCRDTDGLYTYLSEAAGTIPEITGVETVLVDRTVKRQIGLPAPYAR
ncbi:AsnC family transcriptional regulator [Streptomyces palmae]|uniref:AsnC family transcriptional regulator n=1 Tax=Streptomyces palmae TaxID=1701085 RepID=A0A4Z0H9X4_9ACTN|nr:AsnC family transcriptional regulator [Streptomyces palmae]TGB14679.1 AsnC family transcriptional regulator [Streptomyces palmae]